MGESLTENMKYKLVLFDLDGTLLDTLDDLTAAVNHVMARERHPLHDRDACRRMIGHGVRNLVMQALPEGLRGEAYVDACLAEFKSYYSSHIHDFTKPYPGIPELLGKLRMAGVRMAVVSNKFQSGTDRLISRFFPDIPFACVLGNREGFPLKPDPAVVGEALRIAGAGREDAVMVGDSLTDMRTAAAGGIRGLAVTWGYRTPAELEGAELVHSVGELYLRIASKNSA